MILESSEHLASCPQVSELVVDWYPSRALVRLLAKLPAASLVLRNAPPDLTRTSAALWQQVEQLNARSLCIQWDRYHDNIPYARLPSRLPSVSR